MPCRAFQPSYNVGRNVESEFDNVSLMGRVLLGVFAIPMALGLAACGHGSTGTATSAATSATTSAAVPDQLEITSYGPDHAKAGVAFNVQPDGGAAMWIRLNQSLDGDEAAIDFNGTLLPGNISGNLVTVAVPASMYAKPGIFTLRVIARKGARSVKSSDVKFTVE